MSLKMSSLGNSDSKFEVKYKKSKSVVKKWEVEFRRQNKRTPTKVDISLASGSVKECYKLYWKLKTQLLAKTILADSTEKSVGCFNSSPTRSEHVLREQTNTLKDDSVTKGVTKPGIDEQTRCLKENERNEDAWGAHLNKPKSSNQGSSNSLSQSLTCSQNVSDKLFGGKSFKKRNPRKSSSFMKSKSNLSRSEDVPSPLSEVTSVFSPEPVAGMASVMEECSPGIKALITHRTAFAPLFSAQKYHIVADSYVQSQAVSLLQQAVMEPQAEMKATRKLDVEWLDRCAVEPVSEPSRSSDSGIDSMESSATSLQTLSSRTDHGEDNDDDDDDIIEDSDTEEAGRDKSQAVSYPVKRKFAAISSSSLPTTTQPQERDNKNNSDDEDDVKLSELAKNNCKKPKLDQPEVTLKLQPNFEFNNKTKKEILQTKIQKGTLNENYVRINLKKKVFVRGKKNFNFSKHKKQQWKKKKKGLEDDDREVGGVLRCFKCGDVGHYARYCQKMTQDKLLPQDEDGLDEDPDTLPTLEDARTMARKSAPDVTSRTKIAIPVEEDGDNPEDLPTVVQHVEPMFSSAEDGSLLPTPPAVMAALARFGHYKFRAGQEQAVMRVLSGQSTLLAISTGSGKSLCYQLPAYMFAARSKCITLVVSPLVSLMEDQVSGSSSWFKLGCLHTNQTPKQREAVMEDVKAGKLCALLVSPEAIVSSDGGGAFASLLRELPPIAFACIDEVHCVSQWSHNFRPSYLMVNKVLREKYGVRTVLGLTATASKTTIAGIVQELGIPDTAGIIKDSPLPPNLRLSMSFDANKDSALLALLRGPRFSEASAILIYCTRRDECERLAVLIRTVHRDLPQPEHVSSRRFSWNAEAYHAGMSSARRKQIQRAFMAGNLRIVVATVAFGMGINKSDIRGVIHYNMPRDLESYVQEVGRAGRDGSLADCHLFLGAEGSKRQDLSELRRHIHSNSVDRHAVRKLLQRVFPACECAPGAVCEGHEVAFDRNTTIQALDLPEENIHTLLCYLELHPEALVKLLPPVYSQCKIQSYNGLRALKAAARKCPPLAVALATNPPAKATATFDVVELARSISWDSGLVKRHLKKLEWSTTKEGRWKRSGILVELAGLSFHVTAKGNLTGAQLDEALEYLMGRIVEQENRAFRQLQIVHSIFSHYAVSSYQDCMDTCDLTRSNGIKTVIRDYFETEVLDKSVPFLDIQSEDPDEEAVGADVRRLVCSYRDNTFNGRAVARIMHGIQSPNYPASLWHRCGVWRLHVDKDFNSLVRLATKEILRLK